MSKDKHDKNKTQVLIPAGTVDSTKDIIVEIPNDGGNRYTTMIAGGRPKSPKSRPNDSTRLNNTSDCTDCKGSPNKSKRNATMMTKSLFNDYDDDDDDDDDDDEDPFLTSRRGGFRDESRRVKASRSKKNRSGFEPMMNSTFMDEKMEEKSNRSKMKASRYETEPLSGTFIDESYVDKSSSKKKKQSSPKKNTKIVDDNKDNRPKSKRKKLVTNVSSLDMTYSEFKKGVEETNDEDGDDVDDKSLPEKIEDCLTRKEREEREAILRELEQYQKARREYLQRAGSAAMKTVLNSFQTCLNFTPPPETRCTAIQASCVCQSAQTQTSCLNTGKVTLNLPPFADKANQSCPQIASECKKSDYCLPPVVQPSLSSGDYCPFCEMIHEKSKEHPTVELWRKCTNDTDLQSRCSRLTANEIEDITRKFDEAKSKLRKCNSFLTKDREEEIAPKYPGSFHCTKRYDKVKSSENISRSSSGGEVNKPSSQSLRQECDTLEEILLKLIHKISREYLTVTKRKCSQCNNIHDYDSTKPPTSKSIMKSPGHHSKESSPYGSKKSSFEMRKINVRRAEKTEQMDPEKQFAYDLGKISSKIGNVNAENLCRKSPEERTVKEDHILCGEGKKCIHKHKNDNV